MAKRILDLRRFHYALASAEHGSFRRAAASLNVQQSTVSRGVRSLEHRIGAELFERGHAGIRPTSAGFLFLEEAILGFDHLERAMRRAMALQRGEFGELSIGLSVPLTLLGNAFEQFRRDHVGVSVELVESTTGASSKLIKQRKLDVAFVAKRPVDKALRWLHLRDARMFVVLPNTHSLAGAREVVLDELRHERIILSSIGLGPDIADHLGRRTSNSDFEPDIQLHDVGQFNLVNLVAREFGVTIVAGPVPRTEDEAVVSVPLAGENVVSLHAVWADTNPNPALKAFLNIVRKSVMPHSAS